ncbi:hypothetical protein [Hydrogenimonas sp.]
MRWIYPAGLSALLLLGGCGSSDGSSYNTLTTTSYTGIFVDSPVDGLAYEGNLGSSGFTSNGGLFTFKKNEVLTFRAGNVILGDVNVSTDDPIVTPASIIAFEKGEDVNLSDPKVVAIAQFLLSADADNDPTNGIEIETNTTSLLKEKPEIRLDEHEVNETIIAAYLDMDEDDVIGESDVVAHLEESENEIENHEYDDDLEKEHDDEKYRDDDDDDENDDDDGYTDTNTTTGTTGDYRLLAWNDLGMHCMDGRDYSVFSILPPYNSLVAQLVQKGSEPKHIKDGVVMTFEAIPSLEGKLNTESATKTNFWDYVLKLFGVTLEPNEGLKGVYYDNNLSHQRLIYDPAHKWWIAEGIPVTPHNDDGSYNMYPLVKVTARDTAGNLLAETTTVLPVSDEMDCKKCHASTSGNMDAKPGAGWVDLNDSERDYKMNILRLHDEKFSNAVADHITSLQAKGWDYNVSGLEATALGGTPVLCASCHMSNALPGTGVDNIKPLTQALHAKHADVTDPDTGMKLNNSDNRNTCYTCHPGATTQCLRGAMGKAKNPDGTSMMQCQSCHGNMSAVGSDTRRGWFDEPNCQSCHQGGQRYTEAVVDVNTGAMRTVTDNRFATNADTPMAGVSLYRFSSGHGDMQCSACHGSTHAIYPSGKPEDNIQSIQAQGYAGTIGECTACHTTAPLTKDKGPHGLHTIGQKWVDEHGDYAEDGGSASCTVCHGSDYRGGILSKTMTARTFSTEWGTKTFPAGHKISCYDCHDGPDGD